MNKMYYVIARTSLIFSIIAIILGGLSKSCEQDVDATALKLVEKNSELCNETTLSDFITRAAKAFPNSSKNMVSEEYIIDYIYYYSPNPQ
jgi:hypothetical protein